jgi:glycerol-3-phosphate dehydrogenase (NAD(P)+)
VSAIGVVNATEVGEALVARLASDGRKVVAGVDAAAFRKIGAEARLVLIDARREDLPRIARELGEHLDPNHLVAHTVHGLGGDGSVMSLIEQESAVRRVGVLAGPLLVAALRHGRPTAAVIASRHPEVVAEFAETLSTPKLRVYRSRDPVGVELSASLVELAVLGCAMADALALGAAARALVIVRAVREMGRLVHAVGGDPNTANGLAGLGDILVRSVDETAPAYKLGTQLAKGDTADPAALASLEHTAARLEALNRAHKVSANLFEAVAALLRDKLTPGVLVERLMTIRVLDE